jgi:uncharacterized RDD family membrane protein YckC
MSTGSPTVSTMHTAVLSTEALGSRAARFAALVVDEILVIVVAGIAGLLTRSATVYYLIAIIGFVVYTVLMLSRSGEHNGQTLGKQWLSLRVVSISGPPVTFGVACKREVLGRFIPSVVTFGLYGFIDLLWVLWDPRKQALHDKVGGTYVFKAVADPAQAPHLTVPGSPVFTGASSAPPPPPPPPSPPGA